MVGLYQGKNAWLIAPLPPMVSLAAFTLSCFSIPQTHIITYGKVQLTNKPHFKKKKSNGVCVVTVTAQGDESFLKTTGWLLWDECFPNRPIREVIREENGRARHSDAFLCAPQRWQQWKSMYLRCQIQCWIWFSLNSQNSQAPPGLFIVLNIFVVSHVLCWPSKDGGHKLWHLADPNGILCYLLTFYSENMHLPCWKRRFVSPGLFCKMPFPFDPTSK